MACSTRVENIHIHPARNEYEMLVQKDVCHRHTISISRETIHPHACHGRAYTGRYRHLQFFLTTIGCHKEPSITSLLLSWLSTSHDGDRLGHLRTILVDWHCSGLILPPQLGHCGTRTVLIRYFSSDEDGSTSTWLPGS